jgi:hypothetical protein
VLGEVVDDEVDELDLIPTECPPCEEVGDGLLGGPSVQPDQGPDE